MSYDIAVWVGAAPEDNAAALTTFDELVDSDFYVEPPLKPVAALSRFLGDIVKEFEPELVIGNLRFAEWPLDDCARGRILYAGLTGEHLVDTAGRLARLAESRGLVCFDPNAEALVDAASVQTPRSARERGASWAWLRGVIGARRPDRSRFSTADLAELLAPMGFEKPRARQFPSALKTVGELSLDAWIEDWSRSSRKPRIDVQLVLMVGDSPLNFRFSMAEAAGLGDGRYPGFDARRADHVDQVRRAIRAHMFPVIASAPDARALIEGLIAADPALAQGGDALRAIEIAWQFAHDGLHDRELMRKVVHAAEIGDWDQAQRAEHHEWRESYGMPKSVQDFDERND